MERVNRREHMERKEELQNNHEKAQKFGKGEQIQQEPTEATEEKQFGIISPRIRRNERKGEGGSGESTEA